jgi:hypothetical protein
VGKAAKGTQAKVHRKTTTSLEANGDTSSVSGLHVPSSNVIQGEESLKRNDGSSESPPENLLTVTTNKESVDEAKVPTVEISNHNCNQSSLLASPMKSREGCRSTTGKRRQGTEQ